MIPCTEMHLVKQEMLSYAGSAWHSSPAIFKFFCRVLGIQRRTFRQALYRWAKSPTLIPQLSTVLLFKENEEGASPLKLNMTQIIKTKVLNEKSEAKTPRP